MVTPLRGDEALVGELTDQIGRTRQVLTGTPERAVEEALARGEQGDALTAALSAAADDQKPIANRERFLEAHRDVLRALELLDREGYRSPGVRRLGPLNGLGDLAVEFVAKYIVRQYSQDLARTMRGL